MEIVFGKNSKTYLLEKLKSKNFLTISPKDFFSSYQKDNKTQLTICGPLQKSHLISLRNLENSKNFYFWVEEFVEELFFTESSTYLFDPEDFEMPSGIENFWDLKEWVKSNPQDFQGLWIKSGIYWIQLRELLKQEVVTWKDLYLSWTKAFLKSKGMTL